MPKDAVATLEATREKLIKKLLEKKRNIEQQLQRLGTVPPRIDVAHSADKLVITLPTV